MATSSISPVSVSGQMCFKGREGWSGSSTLYGKTTALTFQRNLNQQRTKRKLAIYAEYNDRSSGVSGDFVAGFLLGGALCGTLAVLYAPQITRILNNENERGFRKITRPIYYDEDFDDSFFDKMRKTRRALNRTIRELNSAIDNVASQLRGGKNMPQVPFVPNPKEATK